MEKSDGLSCDAIFVQGGIRTSVFWNLGKDCQRLPGLSPMRRLFPRLAVGLLWNEVVEGLLQRGNVVRNEVPVMDVLVMDVLVMNVLVMDVLVMDVLVMRRMLKGCGKEGIGECGRNGVENELRR